MKGARAKLAGKGKYTDKKEKKDKKDKTDKKDTYVVAEVAPNKSKLEMFKECYTNCISNCYQRVLT